VFLKQASHCMPTRLIHLRFGDEVDAVVCARMQYAFRIFAAIYGHRVVSKAADAETCCVYGRPGGGYCSNGEFLIPARYTVRARNARAPILQKHRYANEDLPLVYGIDGTTGRPDWLGEIFEWLSASLECASEKKDAVGRIPYSGTVFHQQKISPFKPHAGLLMAWMENCLHGNMEPTRLPKAPSALPGVEHAVICSHDIDFYYTGTSAAFERLGKNMLISLLHYRDASFLFANVKMTTNLLRGRAVGGYIPAMLDRIESLGFRSTLFAVTGGTHRRDPKYRIEQIAPHLLGAARRGFGVGVHGSYNSIVKPNGLRSEAVALENVMGRKPTGNRQHWLRFDRHDKLYRRLHEAGFAYDSSLGFSETCGFRNGANFAFPPYDFENEQPCSFLEIPLVIMDGSLQSASRKLRRNPQDIADEILNESRRVGWGGISVLWHNPMEAIQVPEEINRVFWRSAQKRVECGESWMSGEEFVKACVGRYQCAGLLGEISFNAEDANRTSAS